MANYHPHDELLMSFAAGQLPDALGLMLACHIEVCAECLKKVRMYEELGGALLEQVNTEQVQVAGESAASAIEVSGGLLEQTLAMLDSQMQSSVLQATSDEAQYAQAANERTVNIPRPLRRFITANYDDLTWSGLSKNIREYTVNIDDARYTTKLYRIKAGHKLPEHTHEGNEYTLVMSGSFSDNTCDYNEGDFILADHSTTHQPRAGMEQDCICLAVMDAPLKMTGFFGRMLNPFLR